MNTVTAQGVTYFSAAGNLGTDGGYLSQFRAASGTVPGIGSGTFMNFNANGGTNLLLPVTTFDADAQITFEFDQPYTLQQPAGSTGVVTSNVQIYVLDSKGNVVVGPDQNSNTIAQRALVQRSGQLLRGDPGRVGAKALAGEPAAPPDFLRHIFRSLVRR